MFINVMEIHDSQPVHLNILHIVFVKPVSKHDVNFPKAQSNIYYRDSVLPVFDDYHDIVQKIKQASIV